jgi:probable F420-dependent oxidoreductase
MDLGRVGIWSIALRAGGRAPATHDEVREAAAELEELGYGTIWLGGSPAISDVAPLLDATTSVVVATGIVNIWQYDAAEVAAGVAGLAPAHRERFLLGIGASHPEANRAYTRPLAATAAYLDGLDAADPPVPARGRVLAALGPRMLALSRDRTAGAHPYLVTAEHTRAAREVLGPGPLLAPEVKVVLDTDPDRARALARRHLEMYLRLENYISNLHRLGFGEEDLRSGGSDRLVDAVVAWGDADAVARRVAEHHDAGADHVCVQVVSEQARPRRAWRELAAALRLGARAGD